MHRALFTHTIRKSRRSHSLFESFHRNGPQIAYNAEAYRYFTTLKQLACGPSSLGCLNPIGTRCHTTSKRNDAVIKLSFDETKKPKKTKSKWSQKTKVTEVTPFSAKQTNATIQIVRAKQLSKFIGGGSVVVPISQKSEIKDAVEEPILMVPKRLSKILENDSDVISRLLQSYQEFLQQPKTIENATKVANRTDPLDVTNSNRNSQEEIHSLNFKAYIHACVNVGMKNRAFTALRGLGVQQRDIEMYTILLHSYAADGDWSKVKEVCDLLTRDGATFTPQVYAAICECIGRQPKQNTNLLKKLHEYVNKASKQGITMNDILDKSKFSRDQREHVLKALYRIDCRFKPKYTAPPLTYTNPLLDALNDKIAPIEEKLNNPPIETPPYKISNAKQGFSEQELKTLAAEQLKNEVAGIVLVKNISTLAESRTEEISMYREQLDVLMKQWESDILQAFNRNLAIAQHKMQSKNANRVNICPYLKLLQPEQYVQILMEELKVLGEGSDMYSPTTLLLYVRLGRKVYSRFKMEQRLKLGITDKIKRMYMKYSKTLCSGSSNDNPRQLWQRINYHERGNGPDIDVPDVVWPWPVLCDIGKFLLNILLLEIKIDSGVLMKRKRGANASYVPVLYTTFRNREKKLREEIRPHPAFLRMFRGSCKEYLTFSTDLVPMVCPPIPWTGKYGGYLITQADLLRVQFEFGMQLDRIEQLSSPSDMYPSLDALNQLGCIPWRVNTRILDLVIDIFNSGGSEKFHIVKPPDVKYQMADASHSLDEFGDSISMAKQMQEHNAAYSLGCDTLYKLSLANHFRDKTFWLPHNMDFRGRVYPLSPHLNHFSSDVSRSLLHFHQKQPLGENGLNWLKLHCINLTGLKKRDSVQDRLAYAESILDDIIESADDPIDGRKWWLDSDEPWQTLACCMEIANAIRSGNPATYMSSHPIHQDGSCNGLQHYAALGRDKIGAISVNLTPCDKPQDVYSTVAALVENARAKDEREGNSIAKALDGQIKRKVIKQTVMTNVYGVTMYGAKLQIEKQLKNTENFPLGLVRPASSYLAQKTFDSLGEMFTSATEIQDWFTDCARHITKNQNRHVEWVTPLGLPVVQPYTKFSRNMRILSVGNTKQGQASDRYGKLNKLKEKNAFPPNFIHSLDSSHMMLTSLYCERAGLTFVSVHDCFWTHANNVTVMNRICRNQFVSLHSQPILHNLSKRFCEQYDGNTESTNNGSRSQAVSNNGVKKNIFEQLPKTGKFDLKDVLDSVYFFS